MKSQPKDYLPFYQFSRDACGFFYVGEYKDPISGEEIPASVLNYEMANFYERCAIAWLEVRGRVRKKVKLLFTVPRKGRKSTLITQSGPPWLLAHAPDLSVVIDSEQKQRSNSFLRSIKSIISGDNPSCMFGKLFGSWKSDDRIWREDEIVTNQRQMLQRKEPSIVTSSVEIGYTGGAPDCIGIDDPMSPESHNEVWMSKVIKHYDGYAPVLMPNGLMWICLTRYDDMDLFGHIKRVEGIHLCTANEAEKCIRSGKCSARTDQHPEPFHVFFRQALDDNQRSIDEAVWPTEYLHAERKKNPTFFAAQYMNDPWSNPDAAFQKEDFIYSDKSPPDVVKVLSTDIAWKEPSEQRERTGDFNAFVGARQHKSTGTVYITRVAQGRWTMAEWGDELVRILRDERRDRIPYSRLTYEELRGGSAGALEVAIRSACQRWTELAPALIKAPRSMQRDAKIRRIKAISQYFQNHQVVFVRPCRSTDYDHDCPECHAFQVLRDQLLKLEATLFDDLADAMADQFLPEVYTAPALNFSYYAEPPAPQRPWDDDLKEGYLKKNPVETVDDPRLLQERMEDLNKIDLDRFYPI